MGNVRPCVRYYILCFFVSVCTFRTEERVTYLNTPRIFTAPFDFIKVFTMNELASLSAMRPLLDEVLSLKKEMIQLKKRIEELEIQNKILSLADPVAYRISGCDGFPHPKTIITTNNRIFFPIEIAHGNTGECSACRRNFFYPASCFRVDRDSKSLTYVHCLGCGCIINFGEKPINTYLSYV